MKRWMILAAVAALALTTAQAQLYKYVDKNGKTVYSDSPPPDADSKQIRVQPSGGPSDVPAAKTSVQRDKDAEKGRKEAAKKSDKDATYSDLGRGPCSRSKFSLTMEKASNARSSVARS